MTVTPQTLMQHAICVAKQGFEGAGELPIGAAVASGDQIVAWAHTMERTLPGRRLVHAELPALSDADRGLADLRLATTLEPCPMCFGTALNLGVREIYSGWPPPPTVPCKRWRRCRSTGRLR